MAFAPAEVPPQARDSPLDARTPAIAPLEACCALQGFALLGQLARGRNSDALDSRSFQLVLRFCRMHPAIARHQVGGMLKKGLVVAHCLDSLPMLVGVFQNLIACHDATLHFIEDDL